MAYTPKIGKRDLNLENGAIVPRMLADGIQPAKLTFERLASEGVTCTPVINNTYVGLRSGTQAVQLPAGEEGKMMILKDETGTCSAAPVTIMGNGQETIDGRASLVLAINHASLTLLFSGNVWRII